MASGKGIVFNIVFMIEKFKEAIDRGNEFGALLTDLSKAFAYTNHLLLVAKLHNYGVPPLSINMIFSYLSNRTHRTKINECFSERSRIEHGVPPVIFCVFCIFAPYVINHRD